MTGYYYTISHAIQVKNTVNKSRFIASAQEIEDGYNARKFLKSTVKQFPDATHHCWAYRLGVGSEELSQYSDAGEPANSAGPPILQAIKQAKITNVMLVVSRYFGGIKLGVSGLVRAYRMTALMGLQSAGKIKKYPLREFILEGIEYPVLGTILQLIESQNGRIGDIQYGEKVKIITCLPDTLQEWITKMMNDTTQGKADIQIGKIYWYQDDKEV